MENLRSVKISILALFMQRTKLFEYDHTNMIQDLLMFMKTILTLILRITPIDVFPVYFSFSHFWALPVVFRKIQ